MRILIERVSSEDIEIRENQTAENILKLIEEFEHKIIVNKAYKFYEREYGVPFDYVITIYDDYIE